MSKSITPSPTPWYYGWTIVFFAALLTMITVGMRMSIGPFLIPMSEGLGISRSYLSNVIALGMMMYGIGMPLAGYYVTRKGTRFVLIVGAILVAVSLVWTVKAGSGFGFTMAYGVVLSIGLAFTSPVAFTPLISQWFIKRRAMALLFLSTGSMAGIAIMTPLFSYTIGHFSWEQTLNGYAIIFAVLTLFIAFVIIRNSPPQYSDLDEGDIPAYEAREAVRNKSMSGPTFTLKEVASTKPFWLICIGIFSCGFSMNLLGTHAVPMLVDHHFTKDIAAFGISLIGLVAIFSTVALGRIASRVQHRFLLVAIYLVRGIAFFGLVWVMEPWQLYMVAMIGGLVWAGNMGIASGMLADIYGAKIVGLLYGWAFVGHQIGGTISTWLGGWAYETYNTHWIAFGAAGVILLFGSFASYLLPNREEYPSALQNIRKKRHNPLEESAYN